MSDITIGGSALPSPLRGAESAAETAGARGALGGRSVEAGAAPSSRISFLKSLSLQARGLFHFRARRAEAAPSLISESLAETRGGRDAGETLALSLKRGFRAENFLHEIHKSAVMETGAQASAQDYEKHYLAALAEGLEGLRDRDLLRLHGKLNGKMGHALRAAAHRAGEDGLPIETDKARGEALREEMRGLSHRMEDWDVMARIEMKRRSLGKMQKKGLDLEGKMGRNEGAEKLLQRFGRAHLSNISAGAGEVPRAEKEKIEKDFAFLAKEAVRSAAPEDHGSPSSKPLAVTEDYLTDAIRQDVRLQGSGGAPDRSLLPGRKDLMSRREISDAVLDYCGGNRDQALRLSQLLNQKSIAPLFLMIVNGSFIKNPYGAAAEGGFLDGEKEKSFTLSREADGAMRIAFRQSVNPQFTATPDGEMLPLDDKKSRITAEYEARLPAAAGEPAQLLSLRYASHLSIGESSRAFA